MDTIQINGTEYRKASDLARDFGYTNDYVGQLCRANKVDSSLVGRTWYVNPESLTRHKSARYRSSKEKTHQALQQTIKTSRGTQHAERHLSVHTYEADDSDLIPTFKQKLVADRSTAAPAVHTRYEARPAAKKKSGITVHTNAKEVRYTAVKDEQPEVSFNGKIPVILLDDAPQAPAAPVPPVKKVRAVAQESVVRQDSQGPQRLPIKHRKEVPQSTSFSFHILTISVTAVACILVLVLSMSLESTLTSTQNATAYGFSLDFSEVTKFLNGLIK